MTSRSWTSAADARSGRSRWVVCHIRSLSMIERTCDLVATLLLAIGLFAAVPLAPTRANEATPGAQSVTLGYVELADDPRYANRGSISGIEFTDLGRPYLGSQAALQDAQAIGRVIKVGFSLERATGKSVDDLVQRITDWVAAKNVHFVLADLQATALKEVAHRLADRPVLLF